MACIKEVSRSATAAFSPDKPYLAAGTMAGAVDISFSSSANLDIFQLDFQSDDRAMPLAGSVASSEPFNRISWGKSPLGSEEFSLGLIAGGLVDGSIGIWNPLALIGSEPSESSLVQQLSSHRGPVRGLEFSPMQPNLLASGADEGEICVWDIAKPADAKHFPPLKGSGAAAQGEISYVSWNRKVQHILASTSFNGTTDPVRRRCSVLQWNPEFPTQLIVASDEDSSPSLRACGRFGVGEGDFAAAPASLRAPKWYQCKAGVSFGFGGKLVSFHSKDAAAGSSEVYVHNLVTEHDIASSSSEFDAAMQSGERSLLRLLCEKKSQESESEDEKETWGFLKVMFEDEGTARTKLLTHLGFTLPPEGKDAEHADLSQEVSAISLEETGQNEEGNTGHKEATIYPSEDGEEFFNNLPSPKADTPLATSGNNIAIDDSIPSGEELQEEIGGQEDIADLSFDDAVQRALVVGDYKGAVAQCISANRMADALVIANVGGSSLWESTRDQYFKKSRSPYLKVVSAMVNNDLMSLVNTRPLKSWKETLALLCTFAQREEWTFLCDTLASRLVAAGNTPAATLCYICAGNIDKTVEIWSKNLTTGHDKKSYVDLLQDLMEKTIVLALATGQKRFSASLCKLVEKYAEILASQGLLSTAMEYLKLMGTEDSSPELTILRDCIALSTEPVIQQLLFFDELAEHLTLGLEEGFGWVVVALVLVVQLMHQDFQGGGSSVADGVEKRVRQQAVMWGQSVASAGKVFFLPADIGPFGVAQLTGWITIFGKTLRPTAPKCRAEAAAVVEVYDGICDDCDAGSGVRAAYGNGDCLYDDEGVVEKEEPKPTHLEYSRGADDQSGYLYYPQETQPLKMQHSVPSNSENIQQQSFGGSYMRGYVPDPYQPLPQPSMFVPSQIPPISQPTVKPFMPSTPPMLKNASQYQQPTLGYQLHSGNTNPHNHGGVPGDGPVGPVPSQVGPGPGFKMPQVVAPTPVPRGFMPVSNLGGQRPGLGPKQPSSPTQSAQYPPASSPAAPPPTVQTVDTSNVPAQQRPVITTLTRLFTETSEALGGSRANPAKRREIEDNSKKLGALFLKLNSGDISKNAAEKLVQLCQALGNGDFSTALQIQVLLTTSDWDECNFWLATLKRMIKTRQNVR
ncbi:hypothetical protein RJ639_013167 [Escallonia herrerae]|uniref:Sec16 Sec23-binding domain-containing protein n=1 Tax=Escallonia herrerae TaxID=1293975 RepID=A0AA88VHX6_9ASTE|nr:hypothetical protein RJ639_013167 [Escallonia herrerae]